MTIRKPFRTFQFPLATLGWFHGIGMFSALILAGAAVVVCLFAITYPIPLAFLVLAIVVSAVLSARTLDATVPDQEAMAPATELGPTIQSPREKLSLLRRDNQIAGATSPSAFVQLRRKGDGSEGSLVDHFARLAV